MRRLATALGIAALAVGALGTAVAAAQTSGGVRVREASLGPDGSTRLLVSVTGGGAEDQVLPADAFEVREQGTLIDDLTVEPLLDARVQSVTVALLIDVSGSTEGEPLDAAKASASTFVSSLAAREIGVTLYAFDETVTRISDVSRDASALTAAIAPLTSGGDTALYDAVRLAARDLADVSGLRNIVVFTDGGDTASDASLAEAVSAAGQVSIPVSAVALVTPEQDLPALEQLATTTGGTVLSVEGAASLSDAFQTVERSLASQYVLSYDSAVHEPEELDLTVVATLPDGTRVDDRLTVVNPRVAPIVAPDSLPASQIGEPGPLASPTGLWLGLGAAFVALLLLFGILGTSAAKAADENRLARRLKVYTRGGVDVSRDAWRPNAIRDRAASVVDRLPKPEGFETKLQLKLDRAAWPIRASEFVALQAAVGIGLAVVLGLLLASVWIALLGLVFGPVVVRLVLSQRITKRRDAFLAQLPETLGLLAGSLKAGYGLLQAVDTVSNEAPDPTASEFKRALTESRLGMPLNQALEGIAERVDSEDYRWVVMAINIQNEVGGNLASLLDTVAGTLRGREQVRRQVKTLSAEGRLSAYVLLALPFLLAAYLTVRQPEYVGLLFTHQVGRLMIGGAIAAMLVGVVWIRNIIDIDV